MADFDKEGLLNMLGSIIGDNSSSGSDSDSDENKNINFNSSQLENNSELLDTAELMSKMTNMVDRLNRSKNNREFVLLSALKPYMRSSRRGKIDTCLKLLQVMNVFGEMKKES